MINLNEIKRRRPLDPIDKKDVMVAVRLTQRQYDWLQDRDISITGLFHAAMTEVGFK